MTKDYYIKEILKLDSSIRRRDIQRKRLPNLKAIFIGMCKERLPY